MWSLAESMELGDFPNTLREIQPSILSDRLKKAFKGPILPIEENFNTNEARNTMFELALASFLSSAGFEVRLQGQHGPYYSDIEAKLGDRRFVIECKRLLSEKRFQEQLDHASDQLDSFLNQDHEAFGIIAIDITKLENRGNDIYSASNSISAKIGLGNLLESALRENWNSLKKVRNKRIIGLLLYIHTPAYLRDESLLTAAKYLALWPLCPQGSPEAKALEAFAIKVQEQVEKASS